MTACSTLKQSGFQQLGGSPPIKTQAGADLWKAGLERDGKGILRDADRALIASARVRPLRS